MIPRAVFPLVIILLLALACSSDSTAPTPTVTPAPAAIPTDAPTATPQPDVLPDDPRALMMATLDRPLARVAQKMAASGNTAFIPVLVDFLRFQTNNEGISSLASFLVRIKDGVPEGEPVLFGPEQSEWSWWMEWLGNHPEVQPPDGYAEWKGLLFSVIDPEMGAFLYDDVKSSIRIEEIVWGGVRKDGIPDLQYAPVIAAGEADYLEDGERVFGVSINGEHRAYPLRILNAHEMANDVVGGVPFALAY